MKTQEWPKLLLKTLKSSDHAKADRNYQTEILLADSKAKSNKSQEE